MSWAARQVPTLDELFHDLRRRDEDWLSETLQQRWRQLEAADKASSKPMRGIKRARSSSLDMEHPEYRDPHDLTAATLHPTQIFSEHVAYLRAFDWKSTPLGSMQSWSITLRRDVNVLLADPRAAVLFWGKDRIMIYNEAYRSVLAEKHPWALGRPCKEVWPDTEALYEAFERGDATGCSSKGDQEEFSIIRRGFLEEAYVSSDQYSSVVLVLI